VTTLTVTLIVGLLLNAIILPLAAKRGLFLYRLISHGQPAPDRMENVTKRTAAAIGDQLREVLGQRRLLKWTIPGVAHSFVMYAFLILATVYVEAYGVLLSRDPDWHLLFIGTWGPLGFAQDLIAVLCLVGLAMFYFIRMRNQPEKLGRRSRFSGSHLGGAYLVLFMIFNVIWTMFLFRGAVSARVIEEGTDEGYGKAAFVSYGLGKVLPDSTFLIGLGLILHIGVMLVFLIDVLHSKHLHIFVAPLNVMFKRPDAAALGEKKSVALGAVKPMMNDGKPVTLDDVDELDEDATLGIGSINDFTWKGVLDFASCTECGRCQSQCPAWNTEKPLSPKMLIMNLRDHAFAAAPYNLAAEDKRESIGSDVVAEAQRPLVGETEGLAWEPDGGAIIDTDVLWSCTNCGACVNQCPVDIEHVDHITDMRRYQVLVESNFPSELNGLFRGLENNGNPWNMSPRGRMDWAKDLPFDVKVVGETIESLDEVDWLFWVGCAGAYEDRAKKTTRAVAELLDTAGVSFGVLGNGETCTGDSARRAGNEFVFQGLAQQNIETLKDARAKQVVSTCPHCMNTLKNEYKELGIELDVIHHTQLLNRLVREGKLTPVTTGDGAHQRKITYHDPCFLGRHNQVYTPPRDLLQIMPGAELAEMERSGERSFCCGAGGARMWMEETIGERINVNRTNEAVATGADQIAVGCPFCRVMLADGLSEAQDNGSARAEVEVLDVAQMLLASVKGEVATKLKPGEGAKPAAAKAKKEAEKELVEPEKVGAAAKASSGGSLFGDSADEAKTSEKPAEAKRSSGGSLFDDAPAEPEKSAKAEEPAEPASGGSLFDQGGSLFDATDSAPVETETEPEPEPESEPESEAEPEAEPEAKAEAPSKADLSGSLFDVVESAPPAEEEKPAPVEEKAEPAKDEGETAPAQADLSGSLFDIVESAPATEGKPEPAAEPEPAEDEAEDETEHEAEAEQEKPKPAPAASSGEKNEPKTDVDISGSGSLFDL
jgi:Fe-S oxidoreductase